MEPTLFHRIVQSLIPRRLRKGTSLQSSFEGKPEGKPEAKPKIAAYGSQRMCRSCGAITACSKRLCMECGELLPTV
jgi:hypothetical protein